MNWKQINKNPDIYGERYINQFNLGALAKFGGNKPPSLKISSHGISLKVIDHEDHLNWDECNQ